LVLLEALALGTPVVSTAIMGTQDVLQQDEGCLIAEEHRSHFAEQINRLLDDDALRTRLAQRGRIYAQRWNEDTQAEALATLYDTLCPKALASTPA